MFVLLYIFQIFVTNILFRFKYEFLAPPIENLPEDAQGPYQSSDEENQVPFLKKIGFWAQPRFL